MVAARNTNYLYRGDFGSPDRLQHVNGIRRVTDDDGRIQVSRVFHVVPPGSCFRQKATTPATSPPSFRLNNTNHERLAVGEEETNR